MTELDVWETFVICMLIALFAFAIGFATADKTLPKQLPPVRWTVGCPSPIPMPETFESGYAWVIRGNGWCEGFVTAMNDTGRRATCSFDNKTGLMKRAWD